MEWEKASQYLKQLELKGFDRNKFSVESVTGGGALVIPHGPRERTVTYNFTCGGTVLVTSGARKNSSRDAVQRIPEATMKIIFTLL